MPRVAEWWYETSVVPVRLSTWEVEIDLPEGTIQRIIGTVTYWCDDDPPPGALSLTWAYLLNVGPAAESPLTVGPDAPGTMMRRVMRLPVSGAGTTVISPWPLERWDIEGQRTVGAGDSLWFSAADASPSVTWWWGFELRILMLLVA